MDAFAEGGDVLFAHAFSVDGVVEIDGDGRGPEHPVAGAMMVHGTDETHRDDRDAELLRDAETAFLEFINMAVASALGLRKNDEAGAGVNGVVREAQHAAKVGWLADVGDGDVAEALHEPTVSGDFEVRFQLPATDVLRDGAVEHEGIEEIDVVDHEEAGALRIETRAADGGHAGAGEKSDPAAEAALEPVMLARVEKDSKENECWGEDEKM